MSTPSSPQPEPDLASSEAHTSSSGSSVRPCLFDGQCPDQCPDFELNPESPKRCGACGHLAAHHKPSATSLPHSIPSALSSSVSRPRVGERWRESISIARNRRLVSAPVTSPSTAPSGSIPGTTIATASKEVRSGFRPTTTSSMFPTGPASESTASSKGKGKAKASTTGLMSRARTRREAPAVLQGIYFVPRASELLEPRVNNSGHTTFQLTGECTSLTTNEKKKLKALKYARISTDADGLTLDRTLDDQATAEHLSTLFKEVYQIWCTAFNLPKSPVRPDWFVHLVKTNRQLSVSPDQQGGGVTAQQLVDRASTTHGQSKTREIYLAINAPLPYDYGRKTSGRKRKGKNKAVSSDSDGYSGSDLDDVPSKEPKISATLSTPETAGLTGPSLRPRPRPRPRPKPLSTGNQAIQSALSPPASPQANHSPTPTIVDLTDQDLDDASTSFSLLLSLNESAANHSPAIMEAGPGPQTQANRTEQAVVAMAAYMLDGHLDPFDNLYSI